MLPNMYNKAGKRANLMVRKGLLFIITLLCCAGCDSDTKNQEDFRFDGYYPLSRLSEVKLNNKGKIRALAVWDSIRPMLSIDSTVRGIEYSNVITDNPDGMFIWLSFDFDETFGKASDLTFHMIPARGKMPRTFMYFGSSLVPCFNEFEDGMYKDTVDIILDRGLRRLVNGEGIRIDTDRGPTEKLSSKQVASIRRVLLAYEAVKLLNNKYNRTTSQ